jgi:hypothetical protein
MTVVAHALAFCGGIYPDVRKDGGMNAAMAR